MRDQIAATAFLDYIKALGEEQPSEKRTAKLLKLVSPLQDHPRMKEETEAYIEKLLQMMAELPPSPGREERTPEQIRRMRAQCVPVDKSFEFIRKVIQVIALGYRIVGKPERNFGNFMVCYFDRNDSFKKYRTLSRWLYRRTARGEASSKKYEEKPERRAAVRAARPSKEEHREAERLRYWKKKGMVAPPRREAPQPLVLEETRVSRTDIVDDASTQNEALEHLEALPPLVH